MPDLDLDNFQHSEQELLRRLVEGFQETEFVVGISAGPGSGLATEAKQDALITEVQNLATEANQTTTNSKLDAINTSVAKETKQDSMITALNNIYSGQATSAKQDVQSAILQSIDADQATAANQISTHTKLDTVNANLSSIDTKTATSAKQDIQTTILQSIDADQATAANQATTNTKLDTVNANLSNIDTKVATASKQDDIITAINGISGGGGGGGEVYFKETATDAFGRLIAALPTTLMDSQFEYNKLPLDWVELSVGSGIANHIQAEASIEMSVDVNAGDRIVRQSKRYFRYRPGKSQEIFLTGVFGNPVANVIKRIGYFDDNNGVFFEVSGAGLGVVVRSQGADTRIERANWNRDPVNGTGDSGYNLDLTKAQIFQIDLQWLGVGNVRFAVEGSSGEKIFVHEFQHPNNIDAVYMTTANLPVRYEILNDDVSVGASMKQICSTVISGGGTDQPVGYPRTAHTSLAALPVAQSNVTRSMIAIRPKQLLFGKANRAEIIPVKGEVTQAEAGELYYEIVLNPTITLGSWTSAGANSAVEYSLDNVTYTGGEIVGSGYLASTSRAFAANDAEINNLIFLTRNIDNSSGDILVIAVRGLNRTVDINVELSWKEVY